MNSFERITRRIRGEKVDHIPNMNIVMQFASNETGKHYGEVVRAGKLLAEGMLKCHEKYGIDCLWTISDSVREAQDLGADVEVPLTGVPYLRVPFIQNYEDFKKLRVINPCDGRAMNDRVETVRILKEASKGEVSVVGWIEGAFAAASNLTGVQNFMFMLMDEPEAAQELLDFCFEQEKVFALAQIQAGADIIGLGDAATSLIGPRLYREFAWEREQKMFTAIHDAGTICKLHICGNINPFLEDAANTGCDILDVDHMVDFALAGKLMRGKGCVCGNFDPVTVAYQGTQEDVRRAVRECIALAPENCIIAAGCELPMGTKPENVLAVQEALVCE